MKPLRWLAAGLIGLVGGLLALVGVILCVTLVLAPIGIPVLLLARKLFGVAGKIVVPRALRHPVDELDKAGTDVAAKLKKKSGRAGKKAGKDAKDTAKSGRKKLRKKLPG